MAEASGDFLSNKLLLLLRETRWILLVACAVYFTVALYGYQTSGAPLTISLIREVD